MFFEKFEDTKGVILSCKNSDSSKGYSESDIIKLFVLLIDNQIEQSKAVMEVGQTMQWSPSCVVATVYILLNMNI